MSSWQALKKQQLTLQSQNALLQQAGRPVCVHHGNQFCLPLFRTALAALQEQDTESQRLSREQDAVAEYTTKVAMLHTAAKVSSCSGYRCCGFNMLAAILQPVLWK